MLLHMHCLENCSVYENYFIFCMQWCAFVRHVGWLNLIGNVMVCLAGQPDVFLVCLKIKKKTG